MPAADRVILLAGGGTGGSVSPLLAVAASLRRQAPTVRCVFVGTRRGPEERLVRAAGLPFEAIPAGKLRRYWSGQNFVDVGRVAAGLVAAWRLLTRLRPAAVVSAGGFVAVPVVWTAWVRRIPVLVHQPDLRAGLANRLSAPFARRITVAFDASARSFDARKILVTGNPIRSAVLRGDRQRAHRTFALRADRPTVLCLGGGTGARGLNQLFVSAIGPLLTRVQVVHLTGEGRGVEQPRDATYHALAFLTDTLPDAFAAADVAVSRAGLGALSELAALGVPTAVVPMPGSHQEINARFFADQGAVLTVEQAAGPGALRQVIERLLDDTALRTRLAERSRALVPADAADAVAREVLKLSAP